MNALAFIAGPASGLAGFAIGLASLGAVGWGFSLRTRRLTWIFTVDEASDTIEVDGHFYDRAPGFPKQGLYKKRMETAPPLPTN